MSRSNFHLSTNPESRISVGSSGKKSLIIDRPKGVITIDPPGYSGGTLLMIALASCFSGDIMGEASKRGIKLRRVDVDIEVDWGPEDACAESIGFTTTVEADASEKDILDLIRWADNDSTIPRTVRTGVPYALSPVRAVSSLAAVA